MNDLAKLSPSNVALIIVGFLAAISHEASMARADDIGPSFQCSKASTPDEIAICNSSELSELDEIAATGYRFLMKTADRAEVIKLGHSFLERRVACGDDAECISFIQKEAITSYQNLGAPVSLPRRKSAGDAGASKCIVSVPNCPAVTYSPDDCFDGNWGHPGDVITSPAFVNIMKSGHVYYCPSHESCVELKDLEFSKGCIFTYVPRDTEESPEYASHIFVGDAASSRNIQ